MRGEKGLAVLGDEDLLVDLLYNLVHNAQKAAPKDGMVHVLCTRCLLYTSKYVAKARVIV